MDTLEQKRAEASAQPGTLYDARIKKFFSRIMVRGERKYLGYFETAQEAGDAYRAAREESPITRNAAQGAGGDVNAAYEWMLETAPRDPRGYLIPGEVSFSVLPSGQNYDLIRTDYRKAKPGAGRKSWIFLVWEAECILCGKKFQTKTLARAKHVNGLTRTCEEHRGAKGEPWSLVPGRVPAKPVTPDPKPAAGDLI